MIEQDGFAFDVGATFFLYPQVLRNVFARCGLDFDAYVDLRRVDPQYRLVFEGGPEVSATYDLDRLEQRGRQARRGGRQAAAGLS